MRGDNYFFILNLMLLILVLTGFAPSFYLRPLSDQEPLAIYLIVHGLACTAWFFVAALQSYWIRKGSIVRHRTYGIYFCVLAPLITLSGFWVMKDKIERYYSITEVDLQNFESMLIWSDILVLLSFLVIIFLAFHYRHQIQFHKRMMVFGSVMIVPQAFVRLGKLDLLQIGEDPGASGSLYAVAGPVLILLSMVIYDRYKLGKVHKATKISWLWYLLLLVFAMMIMRSGLGVKMLEMMRAIFN